MVPQNTVSAAYEHLLNLGMQVSFGLFNEYEMQRFEHAFLCFCCLPFSCLANAHPGISESHQSEDHGNQILVTEPVVILRKPKHGLRFRALDYINFILDRRVVV